MKYPWWTFFILERRFLFNENLFSKRFNSKYIIYRALPVEKKQHYWQQMKNTNNLNYRYPFVTSLLSFWLGVQKRVVVPAKKVNHLSSSIMFELLSISPSSVLELDSVPSSSTCSSDIFGTKAWGGCDPRICFVLFSFFFFWGGGGYAPYSSLLCPLCKWHLLSLGHVILYYSWAEFIFS